LKAVEMDKRLNNLKKAVPFKKGYDERRNVKGLNRKDKIDIEFDRVSEEDIPEVIKAGVTKAKKGDSVWGKILLEYCYGRPQNHIDVTSGGEAIKIVSVGVDLDKI
jgi:hypothetical protein